MEKKCWIYEGAPEKVSLIVPDAKPEEGGYIMIVILENGSFHVFATRFPGRSISGWKREIKKFSGAKISSVLISAPRVRYEGIKRTLIGFFEMSQPCDIQVLKQKAETLLAVDDQVTEEKRSFTERFSHLYRRGTV